MAKMVKGAGETYEADFFANLAASSETVIKKLDAVDAEIIKITKDLTALLNQSDSKTVKGLNDIFTATDKLNKQTQRAIGVEKQRAANQKIFDLSRKQQLQAEQALQKQRERGIAQMQKEAKAAAEAARPYKQLETALGAAQRKYQDLAAAGLAQTKVGKATLQNVTQLRGRYEAINGAIGKNQFAVGRYKDAVAGLNSGFKSAISLASQFGAALSGVALAKGSISTIVEFDSKLADLSAITGATGKDLNFLRDNAIKLGIDVKGGASSVVEAYKLIASAKPELLENAHALNQVTEAAILLSHASGMELPDAATALTDAMNQFGVDARHAAKFVDILAAGAKYGAAEIPGITEALLKFGPVAKTANVSIQESTALIEDLAEKGLKGADAGTDLRNVMLKLSAPDALPKKAREALQGLGIDFKKLSDPSKTFAQRLEILKPLLKNNAALVETFGLENASAATTLLRTTDRIKTLTKSVDENGVAEEQATARSKTIEMAYTRFIGTIQKMVLEFANGSNSAGKLVDAIDFMRRNLGAIISAVYELVKAFVIFKTIMKTMAAVDFIRANGGIKEIGKSLLNVTKSTKDTAEGLRGLKSAFTGIAWTAIADLILKVATEIYNVLSGATALEYKLKQIADGQDAGTKSGQKFVDQLDKQIQKETNAVNIRLSQGKITEKQAISERKAIIENGKTTLKTEVERLRSIKKTNDADLSASKSSLKRFKDQMSMIDYAGNKLVELSKKQRKVADLTKVDQAYTKKIEELLFAYQDLSQGAIDATISENDFANAQDSGADATKKKTKALKDANDQIQKMTDLLKEQDDLINNGATADFEKNIASAIKDQLEAINEDGRYSLEIINQLIKAEKARRLAIIDTNAVQEIDNAANPNEVVNAGLRRNQAIADLDEQFIEIDKSTNEQLEKAGEEHRDKTQSNEERAHNQLLKDADDYYKKLKLQGLLSNKTNEELDKEDIVNRINALQERIALEKTFGHETLDLETELAELKRQKKDKEAEKDKQRIKDLKDFSQNSIKEGLKAAQEASQKREAIIDKDIEASQKFADQLRESAKTTNANNTESIAAQDAITTAKTKQKAKEQKQQQEIEQLQLLYDATQQYIDKGDSLPIAAGKAITQITGIKALFNAAKGFFKGTKGRLGQEDTPFAPGRDGHFIRADGSEGILSGDKMDKLEAAGITDTEEITANAIAFRKLGSGQIVPKMYGGLREYDDNIVREIKDLKQIIKEKTEFSLQMVTNARTGAVESMTLDEITPTKHMRTRHEKRPR